MAIPPEDREKFPPVSAPESTWKLHANPGRLEGAADAWRRLAKAATDRGDDIDADTRNLLGSSWVGPARDSFGKHQSKLITSLDGASTNAGKLADALDGVAGLLRTCQSSLDGEYDKVKHKDVGGTFYPSTEAEQKLINGAIAEAKTLRDELNKALKGKLGSFDKSAWETISSDWMQVAEGGTDPFTLPPEATTDVGVIMVDGRAVVNTGAGDDKVKVRIDPKTGDVIININGSDHYYPPGTPVTIRAGEGNDVIEVPKGTNVKVTLLGGLGDDEIRGGDGDETIVGLHGNDKIYGGEGNDYVSAGSGRDYVDGQRGNDILAGGTGDDVIYGLGGDDQISGGRGRDYLEGATGNDTIHGGDDDDIISGGRDNDRLAGGAGSDTFYGGHGKDAIEGGTGDDKAYRQDEDSVIGVKTDVRVEVTNAATFIEIKGSDEFKERIMADIDMMRGSPRGQQMLAELDHIHSESAAPAADWPILGGISYQGNPLVIQEGDSNTASSRPDIWHNDGFGLAEKYTVEMNPGKLHSSDERPPIAGLFHEFAHVYDFGNNTSAPGVHEGEKNDPRDVGIDNDEREAVGLPIDDDTDPNNNGQLYPDHPKDLTENAFRDEMGWDPRESYR